MHPSNPSAVTRARTDSESLPPPPPYATWSLLILMGGVYVASLFLPLSYEDVVRYGVVADRPRLLGLFASLFLHVSGFHFLFNAAFLWLFGRKVEGVMGSVLFLAMFLVVGGAANLAQIGAVHLFLIAEQDMPLLGASGAVSGVMGAFAALFPRARLRLSPPNILPDRDSSGGVPAVWVWGTWIAVQIAGVAWNLWGGRVEMGFWSHGAGFLLGVVLARGYARATGSSRRGASPAGGMNSAPGDEDGRSVRHSDDSTERTAPPGGRDNFPSTPEGWEFALLTFLRRRQPEAAYEAYHRLAEAGKLAIVPPERRLEVAFLLENTGHPGRAVAVLEALVKESPSEEVTASALLASARIFAGPMGDPRRAEEALRLVDNRYSRTRAALLASAERRRLKSGPIEDN